MIPPPTTIILDFDGTLSLIRSGWPGLMETMLAEVLPGYTAGDADFILRMAGKETIYQMMFLAGEVSRRGGAALAPEVYKRQFLERLGALTAGRIEALRRGDGPPDRYLVPGARAMLEALRGRGLRLFLASGTDEVQLKEEAALLDIARYFDGGIFGGRADRPGFAKRELIDSLQPARLVVFGDGPIEMEEARRVGAVAVGVATDEPLCEKIDERKRRLLLEAGAEHIIPNFLDREELLPRLFGSRFSTFDRSRLVVKPLAERTHDLALDHWLSLEDETPPFSHRDLSTVAGRLVEARGRGAARILMMGAHVLRAGVNRHIIDMVRCGLVDHIAMNGAGAIHDYELALIGATTESVNRYIRTGEFGLWNETGELNEWIAEAAQLGLGLGENIGRRIGMSSFPQKDLSVCAAAYARGVPVTIHAGIGYDIINEHPNADGASLGAASYRDFLIFARAVERLENGVLLNFGSAVMGPEVYLKALAMARNVARQDECEIRHFTTAVFDLVPIGGDHRRELPKTDPGYYFRPQKTILVRTVSDGGESFYFEGPHRATLPALWRLASGQDR